MSYTKTQWNNDTAPAINEDNLNKIEQGIYDNDSHIGDLSDLETTANTDLVSAINENVDNIGDLSTLTTTADTDLVSAINELDSGKAPNELATASRNGLMSSADFTKLGAMAINNSYGTATGEAYSQNYINTLNTYSSNEIRIGTWIDGKPLYRKVAEFTAPTGSTSSVSVPALAVSNGVVRNYHGITITANGYVLNENYQEGAYAQYAMAISISNGNIYFPQHSAIPANTKITLVVEYTKTTD